MLKIGELAKLCNVSTQTLRYYDAEKLLCPEHVDKFSGYRYYSAHQIDVLNHILHLKALGFELNEIKRLLAADKELQIKMYQKKIEELRHGISAKKDCIAQLNQMCLEEGDIHASRQEIFRSLFQNLQFENEEAVIGKWELRGRVKQAYEDIPSDQWTSLQEALEEDNESHHKTLYFLPGGAFYWKFGWSRGVLYRISLQHSLLVPNEYTAFTDQGRHYLRLTWIDDSCFSGNNTSYQLIYQQIDTKHYTEKETRLCRDDTDIPYIPDEALIGKWKACALVSSVSEFFPERTYDIRELSVSGLEIWPRGLCIKKLRGMHGSYESPLSYSKGLIINVAEELTERYNIHRYPNTDRPYLFVEHKSGDYQYEGKIFVYYVFEKES